MSLTLFDLGLAVLLISFDVRLIMIGIPLIKFARMFRGNVRQGSSLVTALEIDGLKEFVRYECIMGFFPYLAILASLTLISNVPLSDLGFGLLALTILIMFGWVFLDCVRSLRINREIETAYSQTNQLRTIAGNVLDGLKYVVYIRSSVTKTALKLGQRAVVGLARKKVKDGEEEIGKRSLSRIALAAIDSLVSFPERVIGHATNWAKDTLDEKLRRDFSKYATRSKIFVISLLIWSIIPAIWLYIIAVTHH